MEDERQFSMFHINTQRHVIDEGIPDSSLEKILFFIRYYQRNTENCILSVLGVDGWKKLVNEALQRFFPDSLKDNHAYILRGDTLAILVEMIQDYLTDQLEQAHLIGLHRSKAVGVYPELRLDDYKLVESLVCWGMHNQNLDSRFLNVAGRNIPDGSNMMSVVSPLLEASKRDKIVRKLAFRAGIVKLTNEVFDHVWKRIVQLVILLLWPACTELVEMMSCRKIKVDATDMRRVPPPSIKGVDGLYWHTPVPRQIEDAASRLGITNQRIHGEGWLVCEGSTEEDEVAEAEAAYMVDQDEEETAEPDKEEESDNESHYDEDIDSSFSEYSDDECPDEDS